jgi:hypothetical protein
MCAFDSFCVDEIVMQHSTTRESHARACSTHDNEIDLGRASDPLDRSFHDVRRINSTIFSSSSAASLNAL